MSTTVEGIIKMYLQRQQGNGQNGIWYKQEMIVQTYGDYPKTVRITFMNEKIDALAAFPIGAAVKVSVNLESKEYNGKWYDSINGWKVENGSQTGAPQMGGAPAQMGYPMPSVPPSPFNAGQPVNAPLQQIVDQAQQNYQASQPAAPQYQVGQVVNGYQMQADGSWLPVQQAPQPMPIPSAQPQQSSPQQQLPPQTAPNNWDQNSIPF